MNSDDVVVTVGGMHALFLSAFRLGFGLLSVADLQVALNVLSAALKQTVRADA